ncbi:MAG: MBL fold metallo-hydrolase [Chloroflexi bacterium]|nr:MBL fold metallo-hydrolase [Chloroflexota bacterium]
MDISWLGFAALRVRTRTASVVMEPAARSAGVDMGRPTADIVTVSHDHPSHANVAGVRGEPIVLTRPGEYEIQGVQLLGVATHLAPAAPPPDTEGAASLGGRNVVFVLEAEQLRLAHLGGMGTPPTSEESEQLAGIDVLIVPVGGEGALATAAAARLTRQLEPRVVIPVCYELDASSASTELTAYVSALGLEPEAPVARLSLQRRGLGDATRVLLLESRG